MAGMAIEITEPSMNPMLDARMAATSTKRRLCGEAISWVMTRPALIRWRAYSRRHIHRHLVAARLAEMKAPPAGKIELRPA